MTRERIVAYWPYPHDSIRVALAETSAPALPKAKTIRKCGAPLLNRHSAYRNDNESFQLPTVSNRAEMVFDCLRFFYCPSITTPAPPILFFRSEVAHTISPQRPAAQRTLLASRTARLRHEKTPRRMNDSGGRDVLRTQAASPKASTMSEFPKTRSASSYVVIGSSSRRKCPTGADW